MPLLTAVGELYLAMGRPTFTAQEPVSGIVETLAEAARRLRANPVQQALENRILALEEEAQAMRNGLAMRDGQIAQQRTKLRELSLGKPGERRRPLPFAQRPHLKLVPEKAPEEALERARALFLGKATYDTAQVWEAIWLACPVIERTGEVPAGYKLLPRHPGPEALDQAQRAYRNASVYDVAHVWHRVWHDSDSAIV